MRRRLAVLVAVMMTGVLASCSGPFSILQPFPVTGESITSARINTCMPYGGRLKLEIDVTAGANPSWINAGVSDDAAPYYRFRLLTPTSGFHWESTGSVAHAAGACIAVHIDLMEAAPGNPDWKYSDQSFRYRLSIVP